MLRVTSDLLRATDDGKVSFIALFDLSAVFDTLDHDILIHRLDLLFGIKGKVIDWLMSYQSNRCQKVVINTNESGALSIKHGVPQGSVLGPILFSLYSQPLTEIINCHSFKYHAYADDTQIYKSVPLKNVPDMLGDLNTCITNVREWMTSNKLKMNGDKTEIMLVGTQYKINSISVSHVCLTIIRESIPISSKVKNLGVILENTLSMEQAVSQVRKVCLLELRPIRQISYQRVSYSICNISHRLLQQSF